MQTIDLTEIHTKALALNNRLNVLIRQAATARTRYLLAREARQNTGARIQSRREQYAGNAHQDAQRKVREFLQLCQQTGIHAPRSN